MPPKQGKTQIMQKEKPKLYYEYHANAQLIKFKSLKRINTA